jgi:hypothetical protein
MKVKFEIRQTIQEVINWCESTNNEDFVSKIQNTKINGPYERVEGWVEETSFNSVCHWEIRLESNYNDRGEWGTVCLKTAMSGFKYALYGQGPGRPVRVEYEGAYMGFLQQDIIPQMDLVGNILDSECESSFGGKMSLRQYATTVRPKIVQIREDLDCLYCMHDHPRRVWLALKDE